MSVGYKSYKEVPKFDAFAMHLQDIGFKLHERVNAEPPVLWVRTVKQFIALDDKSVRVIGVSSSPNGNTYLLVTPY